MTLALTKEPKKGLPSPDQLKELKKLGVVHEKPKKKEAAAAKAKAKFFFF